MGNILELLKSKKFKVLLVSIIGLALSVWAQTLTVDQALSAAWPLVLAYLGAQGLSDAFGKGKIEGEAAIKKAAELPAPAAPAPAPADGA